MLKYSHLLIRIAPIMNNGDKYFVWPLWAKGIYNSLLCYRLYSYVGWYLSDPFGLQGQFRYCSIHSLLGLFLKFMQTQGKWNVRKWSKSLASRNRDFWHCSPERYFFQITIFVFVTIKGGSRRAKKSRKVLMMRKAVKLGWGGCPSTYPEKNSKNYLLSR